MLRLFRFRYSLASEEEEEGNAAKQAKITVLQINFGGRTQIFLNEVATLTGQAEVVSISCNVTSACTHFDLLVQLVAKATADGWSGVIKGAGGTSEETAVFDLKFLVFKVNTCSHICFRINWMPVASADVPVGVIIIVGQQPKAAIGEDVFGGKI